MEKLYLIILLEIVFIILVEIIICYIIKIQFSLKNEARLAKYAITPKSKYNLPYFERLRNQINVLVKKLSKILNKSEFLKKYSKKYNKYLDYREKKYKTAMDFISLKFLIAFGIWFLYLITSLIRFKFNVMLGLIVFVFSFFLLDIYLFINKKEKTKHLEEDLLESVIIMNNAFKSGKNILEALEIVKEEIKEPLKDEFSKIYLDLTHGLDIDVVFKRFYERIKIEDIKYMTSSLTLLNKTGGNIVKVFSSIEQNFYDKKVLEQELTALTSSSKLMYSMLLLIPFILVFIIVVLNPTYFKPLLSKPGIVIILLSLILYIAYALIIRKVMKVKL